VARKIKSEVASQIGRMIDKAIALAGRSLFDPAWEILRSAEALANSEGIASGTLWRCLGAIADERGDAAKAVKYVVMAVNHDPAAPEFLHSFALIRDRVLFTFHQMDPKDEAIRPFFDLIAALDAIDACPSAGPHLVEDVDRSAGV
jgi:hypothetical protein